MPDYSPAVSAVHHSQYSVPFRRRALLLVQAHVTPARVTNSRNQLT